MTDDPDPEERMTWFAELAAIRGYVACCAGYRGSDAHEFRWIYGERGPPSENRDAKSNFPELFMALPGSSQYLPAVSRAMIYKQLDMMNKQGREAG